MLEPRELSVPDGISANTLKDMDRQMGHTYEKKYIEFTEEDRELIVDRFKSWRMDGYSREYENISEFCYSAKKEEIASKDYTLVPSRYIEYVMKRMLLSVVMEASGRKQEKGSWIDQRTFFVWSAKRKVFIRGRRLWIISNHTEETNYCFGMLDEKGCDGMIVDDYSEIRVVSGNAEGAGYIEIQSGCKYFSLLAAGGDAHGVTIRDAKYNIEDADLCTSFPLGVSNEVPEGNIAKVSVREGRLFVITVVSE